MNNKRPNYYNSREWNELSRWWQEQIYSAPPPDWIRDMMAHYRKTGTYRRKDVRRLLGDPCRGVSFGPDFDLEAWFLERCPEENS